MFVALNIQENNELFESCSANKTLKENLVFMFAFI